MQENESELSLPFDVKKIKKGDLLYFTRRNLENAEGEETGKVIIWRFKDEANYSYALLCPFCGEKQSGEANFSRRPYRLRCKKCKRSMTIKRLKDL